MNLRFGWKNRPKVSLDISDRAIRFVDVKQPETGAVRKFDERELPNGVIQGGAIADEALFRRILSECVRKWGIKRREVQFHVPDPFIFLRKIELPEKVLEDEIRAYLYMEIGSTIHLPFEEAVFDYHLDVNDSGKKEIILFAAPRQVVTQYADALKSATLKPTAADLSSLSIYRLFFEMDIADPKEHSMCIQYEGQTANVSIFHEHQPVFIRQVLSGNEEESTNDLLLQDERESTLNNKLADTFVEIERIMNFYRYSLHGGNAQITNVIVIGDRTEPGWLEEELGRLVDVPIHVIRESGEKTVRGYMIPVRYMRALGLALKEVL